MPGCPLQLSIIPVIVKRNRESVATQGVVGHSPPVGLEASIAGALLIAGFGLRGPRFIRR